MVQPNKNIFWILQQTGKNFFLLFNVCWIFNGWLPAQSVRLCILNRISIVWFCQSQCSVTLSGILVSSLYHRQQTVYKDIVLYWKSVPYKFCFKQFDQETEMVTLNAVSHQMFTSMYQLVLYVSKGRFWCVRRSGHEIDFYILSLIFLVLKVVELD